MALELVHLKLRNFQSAPNSLASTIPFEFEYAFFTLKYLNSHSRNACFGSLILTTLTSKRVSEMTSKLTSNVKKDILTSCTRVVQCKPARSPDLGRRLPLFHCFTGSHVKISGKIIKFPAFLFFGRHFKIHK